MLNTTISQQRQFRRGRTYSGPDPVTTTTVCGVEGLRPWWSGLKLWNPSTGLCSQHCSYCCLQQCHCHCRWNRHWRSWNQLLDDTWNWSARYSCRCTSPRWIVAYPERRRHRQQGPLPSPHSVNILSEAAIREALTPATGGGSIGGTALNFT